MNEIKELYCASAMIYKVEKKAEFTYSAMEIERCYDSCLETKHYYFTSPTHSTRYFNKEELNEEYRITDELTAFYSDDKQKCIRWLKEKREHLLNYHKDLYERIEQSEIREV